MLRCNAQSDSGRGSGRRLAQAHDKSIGSLVTGIYALVLVGAFLLMGWLLFFVPLLLVAHWVNQSWLFWVGIGVVTLVWLVVGLAHPPRWLRAAPSRADARAEERPIPQAKEEAEALLEEYPW